MTNATIRYSDEELAAFKEIIDKRLEKTRNQLRSIEDQLKEITENTEDEGVDWMDDSSTTSGVEMLNTMASRQRLYLKELEKALVRIRNKSYGICVVTGNLIDKRRLMAVPTTTKSLIAKQPKLKKKPRIPPSAKLEKKKEQDKSTSPKVITKVIKKARPEIEKQPKRLSRDFLNEEEEDLDILKSLNEDLVPLKEYDLEEEVFGEESAEKDRYLDGEHNRIEKDEYDF